MTMPLLKSGFEVTENLLAEIATAEVSQLEWKVVEYATHPLMDEIQEAVHPVAVNGLELPTEPIVYYLVTKFEDENGRQEVFAVEDSSANAAPGKTEYSIGERKTIPVDTRDDAESLVMEVLRRFLS